MSDNIFICGLKAQATIGVYDYEKTIQQPIELDITLHLNTAKSAHSDNIHDTINYADLVKQVTVWIEQTRFELIETLAQYIAEKLLETFSPQAIHLRLKKFPRGLDVDYVALEIKRENTHRQASP